MCDTIKIVWSYEKRKMDNGGYSTDWDGLEFPGDDETLDCTCLCNIKDMTDNDYAKLGKKLIKALEKIKKFQEHKSGGFLRVWHD